MKILHLTLHRKWFDLIATGQKTEEYREIKPYWDSRLKDRDYDIIHFRNGYGKDRPFMSVEFKGIKIKDCYAIQLGKILEIQNWEGVKKSKR